MYANYISSYYHVYVTSKNVLSGSDCKNREIEKKEIDLFSPSTFLARVPVECISVLYISALMGGALCDCMGRHDPGGDSFQEAACSRRVSMECLMVTHAMTHY